MTLGADFKHRALLEKHGSKGKPGYRLLHPGRAGKAGSLEAQRVEGTGTKQYNDRLRQYGARLQGAKSEKDIVALVMDLQEDSALSTKDYDHILDEVEAWQGKRKPQDKTVGERPAEDAPKVAPKPVKRALPAKTPAKAQPAPGPATRQEQAEADIKARRNGRRATNSAPGRTDDIEMGGPDSGGATVYRRRGSWRRDRDENIAALKAKGIKDGDEVIINGRAAKIVGIQPNGARVKYNDDGSFGVVLRGDFGDIKPKARGARAVARSLGRKIKPTAGPTPEPKTDAKQKHIDAWKKAKGQRAQVKVLEGILADPDMNTQQKDDLLGDIENGNITGDYTAIGIGTGDQVADGPDGNWSDSGPPWPKAILTGTPAAKHFEKGGRLKDAPADGLFDFIFQQDGIENARHLGGGVLPGKEGVRGGKDNVAPVRPRFASAQPDRFRVTPAPNPGISPNYFVEELDDQGNVVDWRMFKMSSGFHAFDIENEVVVSKYLGALGVQVPKADFARNPAHKGQKVVQMEHAGVLNPNYDEKNPDGVGIMDFAEVRNPERIRPYRDGVLMMDVLDWMIQNHDRHGRNWMVVKMDDGSYKPAIIDNGGGFQGSYRGGAGRFSPGNQRRLLQQMYGMDPGKMERDIAKIQDQMRKMNMDEFINQFTSQPGASSTLKAHYARIRAQLGDHMDVFTRMSPRDIAKAYGVS